MQVRDLIEQLQRFDPRNDVKFEVRGRTDMHCHACDAHRVFVADDETNEFKITRGLDAAVIQIAI